MSRRIAYALALVLLAAGCQATATGTTTLTKVSTAPKASNKPAAAIATRSIALRVVGPQLLANGGAAILNDAGAGLLQGGQILNDAGAGLVAAGGGNLVAAGGGNFKLLEAESTFVAVDSAAVQALGLDGQPIGAVLTSNARGEVTVSGLPMDTAASFVAAFKVDGKVYRLAAVLGADAGPETLMVDPINTMVEARVREVLAGAGKTAATALTNERLKAVWGICNKADVTVAPEDLEAGRPLAELTAALSKVWTKAIEAKVTTPSEKAEIKAFMTDLAAASK